MKKLTKSFNKNCFFKLLNDHNVCYFRAHQTKNSIRINRIRINQTFKTSTTETNPAFLMNHHEIHRIRLCFHEKIVYRWKITIQTKKNVSIETNFEKRIKDIVTNIINNVKSRKHTRPKKKRFVRKIRKLRILWKNRSREKIWWKKSIEIVCL